MSLDNAINQSKILGDDHEDSVKTKPNFLKNSANFSMEMDPEMRDDRPYPGVLEIYQANCHDPNKRMQLQKGLSNYSSLKMGDDRITVKESILSASYRIPVEHLMEISSPSRDQSKLIRKREYQEALKKVGEIELNRLERVMKDKLFQRSYATSSPFQVRKAFKFFDREIRLKISIEGFTRALEFLGFQFSEMQNLALFARYDTKFSGEIDYMYFIQNAMFYPAVEPDFGEPPQTPATVITDVKDAPDIASEEVLKMQKDVLKEIYDKVDREKRNALDEKSFQLLLKTIGFHLTKHELEHCYTDMGIEKNGTVPFETFFEWWTDPIGAGIMNIVQFKSK